MSKQTTKTLVPKLRFPEFRDSGEWTNKPLKDIATIVMGSSPKSSSYNDEEKGLPLLQGNADIKNRESVPRIYTSQTTKECLIDDILLSVRAPVGTVAKSKHHACIGRGIAAIRANKNKSHQFLYQWFLFFESKWHRISQGGTFDAVNSDDIKFLTILIPNSKEQQKIANCLSSIDELITAHTQKHEALKAHKKGLMQQLFPATGETVPKLRFPEFRDAGEWEEKTLQQLCSINQGLQIPISKRYTEQVEDSYFYITNEFLKKNSKNKYFIKNPTTSVICDEKDILMTRTGNTGQVVTNICGVFHNNFFKIKYSTEINKNFFVCFLRSARTQRTLLTLAGSSTIPDLNHKDFYRVEIELPTLKEQQKIANCLSSIDNLITAQSQKIESLKAHKKGLMQQLFPSTEALA